MKVSTFAAVVLANLVSADLAQESLSEHVGDIPSCAFSAFAKGMSDEGCKTTNVDASDFDCLCKHSSTIVVTVERIVEVTCVTDFAQAVGSLCGVWLVSGTDASDLPAATKLLASELNGHAAAATTASNSAAASGSAGSSSGSAAESKAAQSGSDSGSSGASTPSGSAAPSAAAGSSSKSTNAAAAPTHEVLGMMIGGAAAIAGFMI